MSLSKKMRQLLHLAPKTLGEGAEATKKTILSMQNPDGGFADRANNSDIYYTNFALDLSHSLKVPINQTILSYLKTQLASAESLDFVHLTSLISCISHYPSFINEKINTIFNNREQEVLSNRDNISMYDLFLSYISRQHLALPIDPSFYVTAIQDLKTQDGGIGNFKNQKMGIITATAAAMALLSEINSTEAKLLQAYIINCQHAKGGFLAFPNAPIPDLLSTATALFALNTLEEYQFKEQNLDFLDSLWLNNGLFFGSWSDDHADLEYTFYAYLCLGCI